MTYFLKLCPGLMKPVLIRIRPDNESCRFNNQLNCSRSQCNSPSEIPSSIILENYRNGRKMAEFHPCIWGDQFSNYIAEDKVSSDRKEKLLEDLKEEVKEGIKATFSDSSKQLKLIDDIQCLGIGYHFEKEIEDVMQHFYEKHDDYRVHNHDDLYDVSLRFRLLRQHGFNVSSEIFNKFRENNGKFDETLVKDMLGLLSLYEATHMRIHGEVILEEALVFASLHLCELINQSGHSVSPLTSQVKRALIHPIRKSLPRLEARHYMSIYHEFDSHNKTLLELAKIDFNLLQSLHRKELNEIKRWWEDLEFETEQPFSRHRIVEIYFSTLGVYCEPQYSYGRILITKVIIMVSYIDDMFDSRGTQHELEHFANAIERWDINSMNQLPTYMQFLYRAIIDFYGEIEEKFIREGRSYCVHYAREVMKRLVNAYFVEAKWFNEEHVPTLEEYLSNGIMTSLFPIISVCALLGAEALGTKGAIERLLNIPKLLGASSVIARVINDITSHKFEQKRGHVASSVECYMKHSGSTELQAYEGLRKRMQNEWKSINEECLKSSTVSEDHHIAASIRNLLVYLTGTAEFFYKEGDQYTHVEQEMKDGIALLLIHPMPI